MKVDLARDWFGPDAARYRRRDNPHQFPESFKDKLPKGAVVLEAEPEKAKAETPKSKLGMAHKPSA